MQGPDIDQAQYQFGIKAICRQYWRLPDGLREHGKIVVANDGSYNRFDKSPDPKHLANASINSRYYMVGGLVFERDV